MSFMELTPVRPTNPFDSGIHIENASQTTTDQKFPPNVNMESTPIVQSSNPFSRDLAYQSVFKMQTTNNPFVGDLTDQTTHSRNPFKPENPPSASESIKQIKKQIKKPIKLPDDFNGNTSLRDYLRHFDRCAVVNEWDAEESALFLSAALRGEAQKVLHGMSDDDCRNYRKLVARLEARYGVETQKELHQARLTNRRQQDGESLKSLAADVRDLCSLAYQDLPPEAQERFCVQHFVDAINDRDDRMKLRRDKPRNLDVALASACELEAFRQLDNSLKYREPAIIRSGKTMFSGINKMAAPQEAQQHLSQNFKALQSSQGAPHELNSNEFIPTQQAQQLLQKLDELKVTQEAQQQLSKRLDELKATQEAQFHCIQQLSQQMQKWFKADDVNQGKKPEQQPTRNQQPECWFCKEKGHLRRDCTLWKQGNDKRVLPNARGGT